MPPIPRITKVLLALYIGVTLAIVIVGTWLRLGDIGSWLVLVPERVWHGEIWRLATYPWMAESAVQFVFTSMFLYWLSSSLERSWGPRVYARRVAVLVLVPALLTTLLSWLLSLAGTSTLAFIPQLGLWPLTLGLIVAFASELKDRQIMLFPLPFPLSGDRLLLFEGAMLLLIVLFAGTILSFTNAIFGFALGLAWFRFDVVRDARRWLLQRRKAGLERKIVQLRKERSLRVVRSDDDDTSYLH